MKKGLNTHLIKCTNWRRCTLYVNKRTTKAIKNKLFYINIRCLTNDKSIYNISIALHIINLLRPKYILDLPSSGTLLTKHLKVKGWIISYKHLERSDKLKLIFKKKKSRSTLTERVGKFSFSNLQIYECGVDIALD